MKYCDLPLNIKVKIGRISKMIPVQYSPLGIRFSEDDEFMQWAMDDDRQETGIQYMHWIITHATITKDRLKLLNKLYKNMVMDGYTK